MSLLVEIVPLFGVNLFTDLGWREICSAFYDRDKPVGDSLSNQASMQLMDTRSDRMTRWFCTVFLQRTERNLTSTQNLAVHGGLEMYGWC
jgi:hypothetical protein